MSVPRTVLTSDPFGEVLYGRVVPMAPRNTLGALLVGSLLCMFLSGMLAAQAYLYTTMYPRDKLSIKTLVASVWFLDLLQSVMACAAMWAYLIEHFGVFEVADHVMWALAVTVLLMTILTLTVHLFFAHRIFMLARKRWVIAASIAVLALARASLGVATTSNLFKSASFTTFVAMYRGLFSSTITLGVVVDLIIAIALSTFGKRVPPTFSSVDKVLITFTTYTVETGVWTILATIASVICWWAMPNNLVFLGIHIVVTKFYTNTFMASLNSRRELVGRSHTSAEESNTMPVMFPHTMSRRNGFRSREPAIDPLETALSVQISVQKTIEREVEEEPSDQECGSGDAGEDAARIKLKMRAHDDT